MNKQNLEKMRHSCEHILHQAMTDLYPGLKRALGPPTEDGFYFDFDYDRKVSEEDFVKIEKRMKELIKANMPIVRQKISLTQARQLFKNNLYKQEWIDEIEASGEQPTVYWTGRPNEKNSDVDLCKGPHVVSTGKIGPFMLLSIAGAYWHGHEKNKMLTRIYGTCFPTQKELDDYLFMIDEAKKRDHRKIGQELELYAINENVGPGLILWLPKGNIIKEELESFAKKTEEDWGYIRVTTPHITKSKLYYTSGHLPYYKKDMYPSMTLDNGEEYYLKPMNCPHHHMIYASKPRSYKELPLRLAEYGSCYRYESSGELFGLMRVRGMIQNDSHIYCTEDQAVDEFVNVMKLHQYYYKLLGINEYHLELALRDPKNKDKYHGDDKMWKLAEKLMRQAVAKTNIHMVEQIGNAAFYGPKIDFIIKSSIGRQFGISTNQIDLYMGQRFNLKYIDDNGKEQIPVIIHRAPLGSHERFIGFLIEHYAGAFPFWLSPIQVSIIPVSDKFIDYGQIVALILKQQGIRVELNQENETVGKKIRNSTLQKIPYMIIIGDKECQMSNARLPSLLAQAIGGQVKCQNLNDVFISLRTREGKDLGLMSLDKFVNKLKLQIEKKR